MNPQIRFGEDLMSRVSWVMMNPGGEKELTDIVRGAINDLAADVARQAGIAREDILEATFVGNPIMHHLLLGISPVELGGAPFALATDSALTLWAHRDRLRHPPQRAHLRAAVHRGARGRRRRRRRAGRATRPVRRDDAAGRHRHQCRDRPRQPQPAPCVLESHGPGLRGRADQLRPARGAGRDRARAHRSARRSSRASR